MTPHPPAVRRRWLWVVLLGGEAMFVLCAWAGVRVSPNLVPMSIQATLPLALPLIVLGIEWRRISPRVRKGMVPLLWFVVPTALCADSVVFAANLDVREHEVPPLAVGNVRVHVVEHRAWRYDLLDEHEDCTDVRASLLRGLASQGLGLRTCAVVGHDWPRSLGSITATAETRPGSFVLSYQHVSLEFAASRRGPFRVGPGGWFVRVGDEE